MNIKNRVKISFLTIIIMIFFIGIISVSVTFFIRKNAFLNNQIFQIIVLQERMNYAIQDTDRSSTTKEIDKLKSRFNQYEKTFEKIKNNIPLNENIGFLSKLFKDKEQQQKTVENLKILFLNEHKVEVAFSRMYMMQEKHIRFKKEFDYLYPKEKKERLILYKKILSKEKFKSIYYFGLVQYYSKETLYQHKTEEALAQWLNSIDNTKKSLNDKLVVEDLEKYRVTAIKIGKNAIDMEKLKHNKILLQKQINSVLENNKLLATDISQTVDSISVKATNKLFLILVVMIVFMIIFITIFGFLLSRNVALSVDKIEEKVKDGLEQITDLNMEVELTQREVIFTMGTIAEYRSKETGNHVRRVAEYCKILALHYGFSKDEAEMLKQASPMHDIGKVAIPDAILNKPGRFNEEERKIMNTHALLGHEMLNKSQRPLLKIASIVAYEHHEKWDGSGYPRGLTGDKIHIYGRITALADVFDALGSDRVYKKAWDNEKIFKLFKKEKGKHFEPKLIDIFFDNLDEFLKVQRTFKDI